MSHSSNLESSFFNHLVANNRPHLDNFKGWSFLPGMLFKAMEKWWGDQERRATPHEGLDLCNFEEVNGSIKTLDRHTKIPAAFAGEILKIEPDFLGKSIYISHGIFDDRGRKLYSVCGHTDPLDTLKIGSNVAEGEVIAVISDLPDKKLDILPHVHITFAWIPVPIADHDLNWDNLGSNPGITLIDPLSVLEWHSP